MGESVLVLDATPSGCGLATHLIQRMGYDCTTVEDSSSALTELARLKPLAVFADCLTLWRDVSKARELLERHAAQRMGPLILVAGTDTPTELLEECWRAGAHDCILRPLKERQVTSRLEAIREGCAAPIPGARPEVPKVVLVGQGFAGDTLRSFLELSGFQTAAATTPQQMPPATLATKVDALICAPGAAQCNVSFFMRQLRSLRGGLDKAPALLMTPVPVAPEEQRALNVSTCLPLASLPESVVRELNSLLRRNPEELGVKRRVPFFCPVEFSEGSAGQESWSSGFSYDLSPEGIFIRTLIPPRPGAALALRLHLTLTNQVICGTGLVSWANPYRQRHAFSYPVGMGVKFFGMGDNELMTLRTLCHAGPEA